MSSDLKNLIKNLAILIVASLISYYFSYYFGQLYNYFIYSGSTFVDLTGVIGLPLSYIFFLTLLFTAFGGSKKYWWIGILFIPAVIFEVYFDLAHIYFPIILGLLGWLLGFLVSKFLPKSSS
ncbi:MAG: hypothetical protein Q8Q46_03790 [Candidatus Giovannonibacteria bacterium]|nr:hypothetical protein [Candidatus Giovannonibacteria bacterium]